MPVVTELDKATEPWGVKVLRYEIKNITPPHDVLAAMEKQMRAEREKRAVDSDVGRRARRRDQQGGRREAAGHQGVGSAAPAADQRSRGPGVGDSRRGHRDRRGHPAGRRGDSPARRHGSHAAARRRAVHRAVRRARAEEQHARDSRERHRHRVDGRDGDEGVSGDGRRQARVRQARPVRQAHEPQRKYNAAASASPISVSPIAASGRNVRVRRPARSRASTNVLAMSADRDRAGGDARPPCPTWSAAPSRS